MPASSPSDREMHTETELLLPWYATGRLDAEDRKTVEAHLSQCEACRALLAEELALCEAVIAMPCPTPAVAERAPVPGACPEACSEAGSEVDSESRSNRRSGAFSEAFSELAPTPAPSPVSMSVPPAQTQDRARRHASGGWARMRHSLSRPRKPAVFLAAQAATIALAVGAVYWKAPSPAAQPAPYRTLSAAAPAADTAVAGNMVVVFRPSTTEARLRATLRDVGAQIVAGPTSADAYVLRVAPAARDAALLRLRADSAVLLAEAIDPDRTR